MSSLNVLLKQLNPVKGVVANETLINATLDEDFDLAIFPEMFYSGYMVRDNVSLFSLTDDFVRPNRQRTDHNISLVPT